MAKDIAKFSIEEKMSVEAQSLAERGFKQAEKTERLTISLRSSDLSKLDEMRRNEPDMPNRSKMLQRLIRGALI